MARQKDRFSPHDELWKREFILQTMKNVMVRDEAKIRKLLKTLDFESDEAQMFKNGWDCCFHCVNVAVQLAISEVGHE